MRWVCTNGKRFDSTYSRARARAQGVEDRRSSTKPHLCSSQQCRALFGTMCNGGSPPGHGASCVRKVNLLHYPHRPFVSRRRSQLRLYRVGGCLHERTRLENEREQETHDKRPVGSTSSADSTGNPSRVNAPAHPDIASSLDESVRSWPRQPRRACGLGRNTAMHRQDGHRQLPVREEFGIISK